VTANAALEFRPRALVCPALKQTVANVGSVAAGEGLLRLGSFLAAVVIARAYGSAVFGIYATALAYVTVVSMLADNGLQIAAVQRISRSPSDLAAIASQLYLAKSLLLAPAVVLLVGLLFWLRLPALVATIVALVALRAFLQSYAQLQVAILKAINRMRVITVVQAVHFAFLVAGIGWCYRRGHGIAVLLTVMVAGQLLELFGSALFLRNYGARAIRTRVLQSWKLLLAAAPMGAAYTLNSIALRGDVVLLSFMFPAAVLGQFAAAQSFLVLLTVSAWLFGSVVLAEMSPLAHDDEAIEYYVRRWTRRLLVVLVPAAVVGFWAAPMGLTAVFGGAFGSAAPIVAILVPATPLLFLNSLYLNRAVALDLRSVYLGGYASAFALGLLLDVILMRWLGALGVAIAAVAREIFLFLFFKALAGRRPVPA
jgi:O-antigen/teichoic acid export membrane protein